MQKGSRTVVDTKKIGRGCSSVNEKGKYLLSATTTIIIVGVRTLQTGGNNNRDVQPLILCFMLPPTLACGATSLEESSVTLPPHTELSSLRVIRIAVIIIIIHYGSIGENDCRHECLLSRLQTLLARRRYNVYHIVTFLGFCCLFYCCALTTGVVQGEE